MRNYLCIDLKSFYASVECVERGLDPLTARLVVADPERGDKTICLAVTPALKKLGVSNRCRIFEIPEHISYIMAPPRMQKYIDYASEIYDIYLDYIAPEDIHVYSIDEVFIDVTSYLSLYGMDPRSLGIRIITDVYERLGIPSACGIGTNLYLAKVALDITAKRSPDFIGNLTEESYRQSLWQHKPLTDFWRIGKGTAQRLASYGILTMKDIAYANEDLLYRLFGVDAELLIDHAWGREPVTMADIKAYHPRTNCLTSGQVLMRDYSFEEGKLIVKEMMDLLCLDLAAGGLVTKSITLHVGYARQFGRDSAHGTASLKTETNADILLIPAALTLYEEIVHPFFPIHRVSITFNNVVPESGQQYSLFLDPCHLERNRRLTQAVLSIKARYGKDAILKGMNFLEAATTRERNHQIGGHKSGT